MCACERLSEKLHVCDDNIQCQVVTQHHNSVYYDRIVIGLAQTDSQS